MKKIPLISSIIILVCSSAISQVPAWQWAHVADSEEGNSIVTDAFGNVYVAGYFSTQTAIFGNDTLINPSWGQNEILLVKYDSSGNILWATSAGGIVDDAANGISIDLSGNIYMTGSFNSPSVIFGNDTLLNASAGSEAFVAKYDSAGNILWARSSTGVGIELSTCVDVDINANVCISGYFNTTVIFGNDTLFNSGTGAELFVAKYDSSGNVLWVKSAGGNLDEIAYGIACDGVGNIYVTGYFKSPTFVFGGTTLANAGATSTNDFFILKYDAAGNPLWANRAGGISSETGYSLTCDPGGNVIVTGAFWSYIITFGSIDLVNANSVNATPDLFVVKYDLSGNTLWAKSAGGTPYGDLAYGITNDSGGNIYVSGRFSSPSIVFDGFTLNQMSNNADIFVTKYDPVGDVIWAVSAWGPNGGQEGSAIAVDNNGNTYITGFFNGPSITFGSITFNNPGGLNQSYYTAKLSALATGIKEKNNSVNLSVSPNPCFSSATISFSLLKPQNVSLTIFDVHGRLVSTLDDRIFPEGKNEVVWNVEEVNAGLYFLKMESGSVFENRKLVVTR